MSRSKKSLTILGKTVRHPIDKLECFPAPENTHTVTFTTDEFTSMCPVTQQPDISRLTITYSPDEWCVESKSLKLYLWGYRDRGVFCEQLAADIAQRVYDDTQCNYVTVTIDQRARGGIETRAVATVGEDE